MKKYKNKVFVLGLADSGYYIVRALHQAQVPVIAFESRRERPEFRTRLCEKKIPVSDEDELIEKLCKTAAQEYEKPVLFLPSDTYVDFFIRERNLLEKLFLINFPKNETIKTLLYKDKFAEYAIENNLKTPKTIIIKNYQGFESGLNVIHFPIILKPFLRTYKWKAAKLPKIFYLNDRYSAISLYKKISKIENRYIIQEWIPGPDSNIYFCLVYFSSYNNCIASFTGCKLKQWPIKPTISHSNS